MPFVRSGGPRRHLSAIHIFVLGDKPGERPRNTGVVTSMLDFSPDDLRQCRYHMSALFETPEAARLIGDSEIPSPVRSNHHADWMCRVNLSPIGDSEYSLQMGRK